MTVLCATSELDVAGRCDELSVDLGVVRDGRQLGSRAVCDRTRILSSPFEPDITLDDRSSSQKRNHPSDNLFSRQGTPR